MDLCLTQPVIEIWFDTKYPTQTCFLIPVQVLGCFFVIHWTKYWGDNFIKILKLAWLESLRVVGNTLTMGRTLKHFRWQKPKYFHKFFFDRIHESWADTFLIWSKYRKLCFPFWHYRTIQNTITNWPASSCAQQRIFERYCIIWHEPFQHSLLGAYMS